MAVYSDRCEADFAMSTATGIITLSQNATLLAPSNLAPNG